MDKSDERYGCYVAILEEELVCAMGCTEPIAIAYAAARARELLGARPDRLAVSACGSIIKNAKSVVVPHTGDSRASRPLQRQASWQGGPNASWK